MNHSRRRSLVAFLLGVALTAGLTTSATAAPAKIPTTLTISGTPNPAWIDETVTLVYKVTPIPDGGAISFGGIEHALDLATGTYTEQRSFGRGDGFVVTALYTGTDAYKGTTYVNYTVELKRHQVTATLTAPDMPVGRGDPFDVTIDLDEAPDGGRVYVQRVNEGNPSTILRWADVVPGSQAMTLSLPAMNPGDYQIRAVFEGTPGYSPAVSPTVPLTVFDRPTTTTIVTDPNPSLYGEPVDAHVTVSPIPDDGGNVRLMRDGSNIGWFDMDWSTGTGTATIDVLAPGDHVIGADFLPTGPNVMRWAPSTGTVQHGVSGTPIESDPPVGTIVINDGDELSENGYAVLTMHATDASGIDRTQLSCDGEHWVAAGTPDGDWGWGFGDPDAGCDGRDGVITIYARWMDRWGTWGMASDSIILDVNPPIGAVAPAGSPFADDPLVALDVHASDAGSGVDAVALSNDGATWTEMPYEPVVEWSLDPNLAIASLGASPALADGHRTVYAKWSDGNGHWSEPSAASLVLDTKAPSATGPIGSIRSGSGLTSGRLLVHQAWTGSDSGSGVGGYDIEQQTDGGAWTTVTTGSASAATDRSLSPQHGYRLRVRAIDRLGHVGGWATGSTFRLSGYSESNSRIRYAGTWAKATNAAYWGGGTKVSGRAGASASITFTGRSIAWVARKGPNRGKAAIYVNGTKVATVDLHASSYQNQRVVWSGNWVSSASRTITIKVLGTTGHPSVDIDAFITSG